MKTHTQVAVIGGGVVGCSVLYHLTKLGWSDVVLLERSELTSGSTWHAAGGMHTLNSDPNVAKLQEYTINLYREIEEISGQSCSIHRSGGIMLAETPERLDYLKTTHAKGRYLGLDSEFISLDEVKQRHPLVDTSHFVGALYDPNEGHVDPSGVTNAYAKAARQGGAEIYRHTRVTALRPTREGGWEIETTEGTLYAELVVNAAGLWAREVGHMVGLKLPVLAMEHQYLVTDELPEIAALGRELPHCIDFGGEIYMRQEHNGLVMGTYEKACVPWSVHSTPWEFGHELLQPDLDRIGPSLEVAYRHFPALEEAGIKQVINGPFTFTPDGNPLVGPVPGLRNYWVACGVMAGFSQGGGVGLALANWMIEGDPGTDVFAMDVARFGDFATPAYTYTKVHEFYQRRFTISFPNEELPSARPMRTTAAYDLLKEENAVFGVSYGLEHALWFAPKGTEARETFTYRRSNAFGPVGEECHTVRTAVGAVEIANYAKYEVAGPEAASWLDTLLANRLPRDGRLVLSPMLNPRGRLMGDFTVGRLGPERFLMFGSGIAEQLHLRWFSQHRPSAGVTVKSLTPNLAGFAIAGPNARALLGELTHQDVSREAFPFRRICEMTVGGVPAIVARLSFTGDLGYEIYGRMDYQRTLLQAIRQAGSALGLRLYGARALNSLRLEKSFGAWNREYTPDYTPREAAVERFIDLRKPDFVGREATLRSAEEPLRKRLATLVVETPEADPWGDEPVFHNGEVVGFVTSGGYAHHVRKSVALAYLPPELHQDGERFEVEILGERYPAHLACEPLFDPSGERMRS